MTRLAVAANGAFFVSASADETVKVWDCRRLEKDVSFRSRLTYTGQGGWVGRAGGYMECGRCEGGVRGMGVYGVREV